MYGARPTEYQMCYAKFISIALPYMEWAAAGYFQLTTLHSDTAQSTTTLQTKSIS